MRGTLAVLIIAAIVGAGCAPSESAIGLDGAATIQPNKLIICTDAPYEPFEFEKDGSLQGIDIDLAKEVASELDVPAEFRDVDFEDIFTELEAGKCDFVASAVSITDARQDQYAFSQGYFEVSQSLLVRTSDSAAKVSIEALAGSKVGVQAGTTGADYVATHAPQAIATQYDDAGQLVKALADNVIDGVVQDFPINSYAARTDPSLRVVQTFSDTEREQYGFAFSRSATQLRDRTNLALDRIKESGRYDEILKRYLGAATK